MRHCTKRHNCLALPELNYKLENFPYCWMVRSETSSRTPFPSIFVIFISVSLLKYVCSIHFNTCTTTAFGALTLDGERCVITPHLAIGKWSTSH